MKSRGELAQLNMLTMSLVAIYWFLSPRKQGQNWISHLPLSEIKRLQSKEKSKNNFWQEIYFDVENSTRHLSVEEY